jgi:hypothetical protein
MAKRLLIAAGESASGPEELPFGVRVLIDGAEEIMVMTPALPSRFEWLASATNKSRQQADERLRTVLRQLEDLGSEASGVVGADDPLLAFADAIRDFAPDHLLIALRTGDEADWQERGLVDRLLEQFGMPITVFTLRGQ